MKTFKSLLTTFIVVICTTGINAQVGIGTITPQGALDITSADDGLLIPRIALTNAITPINTPTVSEIVYNTATVAGINGVTPGFYYWSAALGPWVPLGGAADVGWYLTGNAGTDASTNFLGTTDDVDMAFRRNDAAAGKIGSTSTSYGLGSANANTAAGTTAFGVNALTLNTTAEGNTAIGNSALAANNGTSSSFGGFNTALGSSALAANTTGRFNAAVGSSALSAQTTGEYNVGIGSNALRDNLIGNSNIAIGINALLVNIASNNIAIGLQALDANTTGTANVAMGGQALGANTTQSNNTAIGSNALLSSTTSNNTAVGSGAGQTNTKANSTFLGYFAGNGNTGDEALIIGYNAGTTNSGARVTTVGNFAGRANAGIDNTYIGNNAGALMNQGSCANNVALGYQALQGGAGRVNAQNTAIGTRALLNLGNNVSNNTAVGYEAGAQTTTGSNNVMVGNNAHVSTGSSNTVIGNGASCGAFSSSIAIGFGAAATQSGHIRIGNSSITLATTNAPWTVVSDRRKKSNIIDSPLGLDFIKTLRPVSYFKNNDEKKKTEYGFIAQEIETALNNVDDTNNGIVYVDPDGNYGLRYNDFIPMSVKAIQEQQVLIEKLQKDNEDLKATNAAILKRLDALEKRQ